MFAIVGTVPREDFPLTCAPASLFDDHLIIEDQKVDICRGTPALLTTATQVCLFFWRSTSKMPISSETSEAVRVVEDFTPTWKKHFPVNSIPALHFTISSRMWIGITACCYQWRKCPAALS